MNFNTNYTWEVNMSSNKWRPGEQAPYSGNFIAYDAQGHNGGTVYLEKGQRFPATQHSGSYYTAEE